MVQFGHPKITLLLEILAKVLLGSLLLSQHFDTLANQKWHSLWGGVEEKMCHLCLPAQCTPNLYPLYMCASKYVHKRA